jgi:hypothetical protein
MSEQAHEHELLKKTTARATETAPDPTPDVNPLNRLQRMIGNRALQRMMTPSGLPIQTKMTVTAANDAYEAEADAVADQVVRKMQSPIQREGEEDELQAKRIQRESEGAEGEEEELMAKRSIQREGEEEELMAKRIQREGEEEELMAKRIQRESEGGEGEEEELMATRVQRESEGAEGEEEELMAKRIQRAGGVDMMGSFDVGDDFEKQLSSARGGGKALDSSTAEKMGGAMGADFSGVRIHEGGQSDSLNNAVQAKAFTTGSDIFFKQGQYNPSSTEGQKLLAHELTHTVQQGAVAAKREDSKA